MRKIMISVLTTMLIVGLILMGYSVIRTLTIYSKNNPPSSPENKILSLRTIDCVSLSGTKITFNIKERKLNESESIVMYVAKDQNGVDITIMSSNYAQWKCDYDLH